MKTINIGLLGAGTVGGGVVKILARKVDVFRERLGLDLRLMRIVDKDSARLAALPVGDALCTADADDVLADDSIDIVVELIGGTTVARDVTRRALARGKHVITANKALIAEHGPELFAASERAGVSLYFEASVGGGMPAIKTIREALVGNDVVSIKTIINGTCNYILTQMAAHGWSFAKALAEAQRLGYAEAQPALDIEGRDAGHKVAIMASLVHGGYVPFEQLPIEGITGIAAEDITFAAELGYCIKLLGIIRKDAADPLVDVRVHPAMLHREHILASVAGVFNAILLEGDAVGPILLYGRGAGELPTASAVVSDVVDVARNILSDRPLRISMDYYAHHNALALKDLADVRSRHYLRFSVVDRPGVLAAIAASLGKQGISIASVMQKESHESDFVPVIFLTHSAVEKALRAAVTEVEAADYVRQKTQVIRIVD
jgi:homoserine dehydrogenase